ncbi:DUF6355 family natural product biosynthesis protein [Lentzea sp. NPDC051838]|uniref:DUF6355 family natural product biosynthesis protein n=1 Tax=Lentzea sp. NPDC051838 TaxID=3154849 RepID=UPI0034204EED
MRRIWGIAAAAAMAVGTAVTVTPSAMADPCGYFEAPSGGVQWAFYNHCGPTTVMIKVRNNWPAANYNQCVRPGTTPLRYDAATTDFAWYIGEPNCTV